MRRLLRMFGGRGTAWAALGVAVAFLAAGCASGPPLSEVQATLPRLAADKGRVWFYRSSSPFGAAIQPTIKLNGEAVGDSVPGGVFFKDVAPGDYAVSTTTEVDRQLTFTLAAGQERYVKTSIGFGVAVGRIHPELIDPEEARKDIATLSYTGGK
jgi:hypothetical protein